LIDGGLKVDGKIECNEISTDILSSGVTTLGATTTDSLNVIGNTNTNNLSASSAVYATTVSANTVTAGNIIADDINGQNVTVAGNLVVNGTQTILNVQTVDIEDPLLKLSNDNVGNLTNMGIYGTYNNGVQRYSGLVRKASDGVFFLVDNSVEPTPTGVLSESNLAPLRVDEMLTNSIVPNNPNSDLVINARGNTLEFTTDGTVLSTNFLLVNLVTQDTKVSAYGQYYENFNMAFPELVEIEEGFVWPSVFPNPSFDTNNVLFTSATNTFTIQVAGVYRFSYHIALQNLDDDADLVQVSLRRNGVADDAFEDSSKTRHYRMKNRANTLSASFIAAVAVGDEIRLY
jgi:hypothetical protein